MQYNFKKMVLTLVVTVPFFSTILGAAETQSLHQIFQQHEGNVSDKWENYLDVYEEIFKAFQHSSSPLSILEIGVQNGGSLQIWQTYFGPKASITGIDVNPKSCSLKLGEQINVLCFDGTDRSKLDENLGKATYNFIIDDGSHKSSHIIKTFKALFHRVQPGGIFIVEDVATSYWKKYEGGLRKEGSAIEYFKTLIDLINRYHIKDASYEKNLTPEEIELCRWIKKIEFRDSMILIYKLEEPREGPYRRILTGRDAPVEPIVLESAKKEGWYVKEQ